MVVVLSEWHARKVVPGTDDRGKPARILHPRNVASNTYFFVSVSKARKETFGVPAPGDRRSRRCANRKGANHLAPSSTVIGLHSDQSFPYFIRSDSRRSCHSPSQSRYRLFRRFEAQLSQ